MLYLNEATESWTRIILWYFLIRSNYEFKGTGLKHAQLCYYDTTAHLGVTLAQQDNLMIYR